MELAKAPAHPDHNSNNFDSRPEQLGCFALLRHTGCNPHSFREVGLRIGTLISVVNGKKSWVRGCTTHVVQSFSATCDAHAAVCLIGLYIPVDKHRFA